MASVVTSIENNFHEVLLSVKLHISMDCTILLAIEIQNLGIISSVCIFYINRLYFFKAVLGL